MTYADILFCAQAFTNLPERFKNPYTQIALFDGKILAAHYAHDSVIYSDGEWQQVHVNKDISGGTRP